MSQILTNTMNPYTEQTKHPVGMQALPLWKSSVLFAIPAVLTTFSFYVGIPFLVNSGYSPLISFMVAIIVPMAMLFAFSIAGFYQDSLHVQGSITFSERMWFPRLRLIDFGIGFLIMIGGLLGAVAMAPLTNLILDSGLLPESLPLLLDPQTQPTPEMLAYAAGGKIEGQWGLLVLTLMAFAFNMVGEELWWRGYILPRQHLAHGSRVWLVHGLQWGLFHLSKWWAIPGILPLALLMSYSSYRLKNNWPTTIAHVLANFLLYALVIMGVLGL